MKINIYKLNSWLVLGLTPLITVVAASVLAVTEYSAIGYIQAVFWGVGLIALAVAVNMGNKSALPYLAVGLTLPVLALASAYAPASLVWVVGVSVGAWLLIAWLCRNDPYAFCPTKVVNLNAPRQQRPASNARVTPVDLAKTA